MEENNNKELLVIFDGDFILYFATHGNKVLDKYGNPIRENNKFVYTDKTLQEVYKACDDIIINVFIKTNINDYIGFLGGKKCFRYDIYPEYKANRKNLVKPKFWQECKDYLIERWNFKICDSIEADDAVNITRNRLKDTHNSIIVTTDKDLIKCIEGTYLDGKTFDVYYTSHNVAEYNFWRSMITGDSTDNIKGLPKCGKVYAEKLLNDSKDYRQSVYDAYYIKECNDFDLNYNLLKILDDKEDFEVPEIQKYCKEIDKEWSK